MPVIVLLLIAGFGIAWLVWDRSNELFCIDIASGSASLVRGQIPEGFMSHVRDVVRSPPVASGRIRGVKSEGGVRLKASGLNDGQLQRIRNAHRLSPHSSYRSGESPVNERNFWRALNLAWLFRILFRR